jgi:hypothetical protein
MSITEQLFNIDINHLSIGNCTNPPSEQDMAGSEPAIYGCFGEHAQTHGQHQEFR